MIRRLMILLAASSSASCCPRLGPALRPIAIEPSLLTPLEAEKRDAFLRQWSAAVARR